MKDKIKILITDDDEVITTLLESFLSQFDFQVEITKNGNECLNFIKNNSTTIIILDYQLEDMTAVELLKKLEENDLLQNKKIIISSGNENAESDFKANHISVNAFLPKPYNPQELLKTIKELI